MKKWNEGIYQSLFSFYYKSNICRNMKLENIKDYKEASIMCIFIVQFLHFILRLQIYF